MVKWDAWRQQRRQRHSDQLSQEQQLVKGQRRRLEALLQRQDQQARAEQLSELLTQLDAVQPEDFTALAVLLEQAQAIEQRQLLTQICAHLREAYGGRSLQAPLPTTLIALLGLLSAHSQGPREAGTRQRSAIQLEALELYGLELNALDLRGAGLSRCRFVEARLPHFNLFAAWLEDVGLVNSDLSGADLTGATLLRVDLSGSVLTGAELISTELRDCDLNSVQLDGAALRGARLYSCDLRGASLVGVNGLRYQQLLSSRIDAQTVLPDELRHRQAELIARSSG